MSTMIDAPMDLLEAVAHLRLPTLADRQLQSLMDANTNGQLTEPERQQLEALVEWSETVSLLRASEGLLLGECPS